MQCLSMPHIRCFRKSGWRERWKTHRIPVPRSNILPVFHQSAPLFGSVLGLYRFILLRFLCFRWVANRGFFKESTQVFIGKMRKKGLKNEKIKLLSVICHAFQFFTFLTLEKNFLHDEKITTMGGVEKEGGARWRIPRNRYHECYHHERHSGRKILATLKTTFNFILRYSAPLLVA